MKTTVHNSKICRCILLCAVTLHWLTLTGLAQPGTVTNQVLSLNGTSAYVTVPSAASLQNSNAITVEAWIYPNPLSSSDFFQNVVLPGIGNIIVIRLRGKMLVEALESECLAE